jgi:hypothetical protein
MTAAQFDLFDRPIAVNLEPPRRRRTTQAKGYAALPGTGPDGKTCRQCAHYCITCPGGRKTFPKCGLMRERWTHGKGTDIKAGAPACRCFEEGAR